MITNNISSSDSMKNSSASEEWKPVVGFEGLYEVSNYGRVKSLNRIITQKNGIKREVPEKMLTQSDAGGYLQVCLSKEGKSRSYGVHVLVGRAFVKGYDPDKAYEINHKDENKKNNRWDNLEWCDRKYNLNYGNYRKNMSLANGGPGKVKVYDLEGNLVGEYDTIKEAATKTGVDISLVSYNIRGLIKKGTTCGLRFTA